MKRSVCHLEIKPGICNNTAIRKAARRITRFYDAYMAETGLRTTQYAILSLLAIRGAMTMGAFADLLSMDRATMGHNLRPLERDGLVTICVGREDPPRARSRIVRGGRQGRGEKQAALAQGAGTF